MATALFGRAHSVASCNLLRLPEAEAWPDSRRYRKKAIAVSRLSCSYRQGNSQPKIQDAIYLQSQPV